MSRVVRFADYCWEGVRPVEYKEGSESWKGVTRHPLVGAREETPFHVRYFEVEPGGYSTFERHEHQHVVMAIRGRGEVRLGDRWEEMNFGDVVYVAGKDPHQFRTVGEEPFGFLCIVDANRDRPIVLKDTA
jgi:quercetin dioxygenase-like cupin family protein